MDEFNKINWRNFTYRVIEPKAPFIEPETIRQSLAYQHLETPTNERNKLLPKTRTGPDIFPFQYPETSKATSMKSCLSVTHHYLCLRALKLFQSGKPPENYTEQERGYVEVYNQLKSKIIEENTLYRKFVQDQWVNYEREHLTFVSQSVMYGQALCQDKWNRVFNYGRHYKRAGFINVAGEGEEPGEFLCTGVPNEVGVVAKFTNPVPGMPVILSTRTLPKKTDKKPFQLSVSQDSNVPSILQNHPEVDIVTSFSSLKCLMDLKTKWFIPMVVKEVGGKRVIFLDKPMSQSKLSPPEAALITAKRLVRTNLCKFEHYSFDEQKLTGDQYKLNVDDKGRFWTARRNPRQIHNNASYRLWKVGKQGETSNSGLLMKGTQRGRFECHVLIRSKSHACEPTLEGGLIPVTLKPKYELQLQYGAAIQSKAELLREWAGLFFIPMSALYRVRLSPDNELVGVERVTTSKILQESQGYYQYNPQQSLVGLRKVFKGLLEMKLKEGAYLLEHGGNGGGFVQIMEGVAEGDFDLQHELAKREELVYPIECLPIDVYYVLPTFEAARRMPGLFTPKVKVKKFKNQKKKVMENKV